MSEPDGWAPVPNDESLTLKLPAPLIFECPRGHKTGDTIRRMSDDGKTVLWAACLLCIAEDHPTTLVSGGKR
jgi:hypothetical protein